MKIRRWNRKMVVWTLVGGTLALGAVNLAVADETVRPGWSLMGPEERAQHQEVMRTLEGDALQQYREAHRESMRTRAAEEGIELPEGRGPGSRGMGPQGGPGMGRGMGPQGGPGMGRGMGPQGGPGMGRGMGP
ncbi:MAG: hypothetical protein KFF45_05745, partial [Thioalkalivibrio sp.]|nr:hypothetical protein [Thioalkalivibrio sp.]